MAETLGSLCDKLTIIKLKQFHSFDHDRLNSLDLQETSLINEINIFFKKAISGEVSKENLKFCANKIYPKNGNEIPRLTGEFGEIVSKLAEINCFLWHEQEKVYEFEKIPVGEKDGVIKKLAILNLQRNHCIDEIDSKLEKIVFQKG